MSQCDMCELEGLLKERSDECRHALQKMNPTVDRDWDDIFRTLAYVDSTRRMLAADREHA